MKLKIAAVIILLCNSYSMSQEIEEEFKHPLEDGKNDTHLRYDENTDHAFLAAELEIIPDEEANHSFISRARNNNSYKLMDHGSRFCPNAPFVWSRLSTFKGYFESKQVVPSSFPSNQIYNFYLEGNYGAFSAWNGKDRFGRNGVTGTYFTPSQKADVLLATIVQYENIESDGPDFLFSAIMTRKTGEWYIFPQSSHDYIYQEYAHTAVVMPGGIELPKTDRKIAYEYAERNQPSIKLILEVKPDSETNHRIERKMEGDREIVLIDGAPRMYDPASAIQWKLSEAKVTWDGKVVPIKNFPGNDLFNFCLGGYGLPEVMAGEKGAHHNGIGIYPSTDRNALYVGFVRKDENSGIMSYAALVIQRDGRCEMFPKSFDAFVSDKGQHVKVVEGYSDRALKKAAPYVFKPVPANNPNGKD